MTALGRAVIVRLRLNIFNYGLNKDISKTLSGKNRLIFMAYYTIIR